MKKYLQNVWVRMLSCILCTVSVIGLGIAGVCSVIYAEMGSYKDFYENGEQEIASNYALYAYDLFVEREDDRKLTEFLTDNSLYCSVEKIHAGESGEEEVSLVYVHEAPGTEWDYSMEIIEGSYYNYSVKSMWSALMNSYWYEPDDKWVEFSITGYVFDAASGIFYYETDAGYFPIENINIYFEDNSYIDYTLKIKDGQLCYYNGYYDKVLDVSQAARWKYMSTPHHRVSLWEYGNTDEWDVVEYVPDAAVTGVQIHDKEYSVIDADDAIGCYYQQEMDKYRIQIARSSIGHENLFWEWEDTVKLLYTLNDVIVPVIIGFSLMLGIGFVLLVLSARREEEALSWVHKLPLGIYSVAVIGLGSILFVLLMEGILGLIVYEYVPLEVGYTLFAMDVILMVLLAFIYLQNLLARLSARCFLRYSEIHYAARICRWGWKKCTYPFRFIGNMVKEEVSLFWKGLTILAVIAFVECIIIVMNFYDPGNMLFWFILGKCIEIPLCLYILLQMKALQDGAKKIASGDLFHPIDTSRMLWEFKKHGDYINNVSESIQLAVNEQMKSERFKTELITNVSHDIKTPLTSIINYVDLIKKEDIADEKLCEYVEVLDRQSARLKKLIEDLMEASKASTGNLNVNLEECDAEVLLTQVVGEFEEKLQANQLEVIVDKPEHPVLVMADGRHMWRVLDNLLGNACKYALPGTRVYVSLKQEGNQAVIVFKNISKVALNIPSEELMERFVRGDSSRNTEGSGLGLSIAQSLTELMHGTMRLDIDGDLFKVILHFPAINM